MAFEYRFFPLKPLYLGYQVVSTVFIRFPYWILRDLPRPWRPRRSWSLKRCFLVRLIRHISFIQRRTGPLFPTRNHEHIESSKNGHGVWVDPVSEELILSPLSIWSKTAGVSPCRIPGYWMYNQGDTNTDLESSPRPGEKVVYHIHGGGFNSMSAHPSDITANIPRGILQRSHGEKVWRTFSIEYRLSSTKPFKECNPFPAALLDVLSGYLYLVKTIGFSPSDIVIVGDSAGGNLALGLARYLSESLDQPGVPSLMPTPPGGLILLSPWGDIGDSHTTPGSSLLEFTSSDYDTFDPSPSWTQRAYLGPHGLGAADFNSYVSPASLHPFTASRVHYRPDRFPKVFILGGGGELLYDQVVDLKESLRRDLGEENVKYLVAPDASHDWVLFEWFEPERSKALNSITKWIERL